jgi:hypothetical protein
MIAYAHETMSLGDWFRRLFSAPSESAGDDAALREEFDAPDEGEADVSQAASAPTASAGGMAPGRPGTPAAAEAAEAEIESQEAPPDPAP